MTAEEILRAKAAGAAKREERKKRSEGIIELPKDFEEKLQSAWWRLERLHSKNARISPELAEEVRALFLPEASKETHFKVYQRYFHDYETLIYYAWSFKELGNEAFRFWDDALSHPGATFTGNSILRILGGRPDENLLKIMQRHGKLFSEESDAFKIVLRDLVDRSLAEPGHFDFRTKTFSPWTERELEILQEIKKLL